MSKIITNGGHNDLIITKDYGGLCIEQGYEGIKVVIDKQGVVQLIKVLTEWVENEWIEN